MFKKLTNICLASLYALLVVGIGVNAHFCQGVLTGMSWALSTVEQSGGCACEHGHEGCESEHSHHDHQEGSCCADGKDASDCCSDQGDFWKLTDSHLHASVLKLSLSAPVVLFAATPWQWKCQPMVASVGERLLEVLPMRCFLPPPGNPPLYLAYCSLKIGGTAC